MKVGVVRETYPGEHRVALVPNSVPALSKLGLEVLLEPGAGQAAGYLDQEYIAKGAHIAGSRAEVFEQADLILQVRCLGANQEQGKLDLAACRSAHTVIGCCDPLGAPEYAHEMANTGVRVFAMELMPRISRAQSMDVLSSMATLAGYKAVLMAASLLPKMFPMMMTAAGTITPAKVFVIGAGVAGLQAIASARKLGAVVQAYDVRPAEEEQCESQRAKFVEMELASESSEGAGGYAKQMDEDFYRRQRELMARVVAENDVVITTAAIPGKKSPVLVTKEMVEKMQHGSVIVDLAAERGGNCELTEADQQVVHQGVTIFGPTNLPSTLAYHASQMYSNNICTFLKLMAKNGQLNINKEDEIIAGTLVAEAGQVVHPTLRKLLNMDPVPSPTPAP